MRVTVSEPAPAFEEETLQGKLRMDESAFRAFYERTAHPLWGYLWRVSGDRHAADDLLQESYCRFLAAPRPAMDEAQSTSYLFRIATNLLHNRWHGQRETVEIGTLEAPQGERSPEERADVRWALEQLKPRERELLWLAYVEGWKHNEIADSTGLRAGSIRLLLFRARRKLAEALRARPRKPKGKAEV